MNSLGSEEESEGFKPAAKKAATGLQFTGKLASRMKPASPAKKKKTGEESSEEEEEEEEYVVRRPERVVARGAAAAAKYIEVDSE